METLQNQQYNSLLDKWRKPQSNRLHGPGREFLGVRMSEELMQKLDHWISHEATPYVDKSQFVRELLIAQVQEWEKRYNNTPGEGI